MNFPWSKALDLISKFPRLKMNIKKATILPKSGNYKGWVATIEMTIINPTSNPILIYDVELEYCDQRYSPINTGKALGNAYSFMKSTNFPIQIPSKNFINCTLHFQTDYSFDGLMQGKLIIKREIKDKKIQVNFSNRQ